MACVTFLFYMTIKLLKTLFVIFEANSDPEIKDIILFPLILSLLLDFALGLLTIITVTLFTSSTILTSIFFLTILPFTFYILTTYNNFNNLSTTSSTTLHTLHTLHTTTTTTTSTTTTLTLTLTLTLYNQGGLQRGGKTMVRADCTVQHAAISRRSENGGSRVLRFLKLLKRLVNSLTDLGQDDGNHTTILRSPLAGTVVSHWVILTVTNRGKPIRLDP